MKRATRNIILTSAAALLITSCSSSDDALRLLPGSESRNEAASDSMYWGNVEYKVTGTLPEMPTKFLSYKIQKQSAPISEVEDIAKVFGVSGTLVENTGPDSGAESTFRSFQMGGEDEASSAMWLSGDNYWWSWSYYVGTKDNSSSGRDTAVSSPCPPDSPRCEEYIPEPPKNLPNVAEVETLTKGLLSELGVDLKTVEINAFSDEWSAWSQVTEMLNGVASATGWYFSFGEDAVLTSAWGSIVSVKKSTTYELADPTEAVSRLSDYRYSGYGFATDAMTSDVMTSDTSAMSSVSPSNDLAVTDGESGDGSSGSSGGSSGTDSDEPMPIEELIDDESPTPVMETFVIEINSVRMAYTVMASEGGGQLLVPAFVYSNDDGDVGSVIALSDDVFSFAESPVPHNDGGQIEPAPDMGDEDVISASDAQTLVGLSEDEAMKVAASKGWDYRVSARDGEQFMLTTDYVPRRVNVVIDDGMVTEVSVG
jgi:hypothetical protein